MTGYLNTRKTRKSGGGKLMKGAMKDRTQNNDTKVNETDTQGSVSDYGLELKGSLINLKAFRRSRL